MSDFRALAAKIAALQSGGRADSGVLPFGDEALDGRLPGGGLPLGRWHEIIGQGLETETSVAPAAFAALAAAPLARQGEGVWVMRRDDLWAPGLAGLGFPPDMFTVLFALARTVGWIAQWKEMIEDPSQKIGRPRQLYTGAPQRDYVGVEKRG